MKVKSVSSAKSTSSAKPTGGVGGVSSADFASLLAGQMDETPAAADVSGAVGVSGVTGIIPTQNVEDKEQQRSKKQRTVNYGNDLLDQLEEIRIGLIKGIIPKEKLFQLSQKLRNRNKSEIDLDPTLKAIIEDIETRVEIELAKLMKISVSI